MSQPNSITVWLRPVGAIQPYVITNCAKWLVRRREFKDFRSARKYLHDLEKRFPKNFVQMISAYHEAHDYRRDRQPTNKDINELYSATDQYGSESQKWTKGSCLH